MAYIGNTAPSRFVSNSAASVYSGDGSTTAFTLQQAVVQDEDILVSVDGVVQEPSVAYAVSNATTLTFTGAPSSNAGNNIFVYYLASQAGTVGHPSTQALSATSGTFSTTLAVTGASTLSSSLAMTSDDPTITMTDSSGTNDIVKLQSTSGALIITARDGNANGEIIFKGDTGSAVTEHMRINNAGIITKPLQPAFLVQPASAQNNFGADGNNDTIAFGTERFDNNADFASNTFTAPVTGKYMLCANLYLINLDSVDLYYQLTLFTSNRNYFYAYDGSSADSDPNRHTFQINVIADMDASDTATVGVLQSGGTAQTDIAVESYFSGALIC